jgi:hypothetical protein
VKIAILNDLHPSEFPGAATIAYGLAEEASKSQIVEYWTSSTDPSKITKGNLFNEEILSTSRVREARIANSFIRKIVAEFFSTQSTFCVQIFNGFKFNLFVVDSFLGSKEENHFPK